MSNEKMSNSKPKAVYSIRSIYIELGLSRSQFFNLQQKQVFPKGLIDENTGRQYFDDNLKNLCLKIRRIGIGFNKKPYLFYNPRKYKPQKQQKVLKEKSSELSPEYSEFSDTLSQMGLDVSAQQVFAAAQELYPDGINDNYQGEIIRELYRHFRKNM